MLLCKPLTEIDTLSFCDQGQTCISRWSGNVCTLSAVSGHYSDYWFSTLPPQVTCLHSIHSYFIQSVYSRLVRGGSSVLITLLFTFKSMFRTSQYRGHIHFCNLSFCLDYKPYTYLSFSQKYQQSFVIWTTTNTLCPKSPSARGLVASLPVRLLFKSI